MGFEISEITKVELCTSDGKPIMELTSLTELNKVNEQYECNKLYTNWRLPKHEDYGNE